MMFHQGRSAASRLSIAFRALGTFGGNAQRSGLGKAKGIKVGKIDLNEKPGSDE